MDDKELEKVSGGSWENIVDDANRFKCDFGIDFATKYYTMVVNIDEVDDFVRQDLIRTFGKCGVRMEFNNESENKYFIGDKEVTHDAVLIAITGIHGNFYPMMHLLKLKQKI